MNKKTRFLSVLMAAIMIVGLMMTAVNAETGKCTYSVSKPEAGTLTVAVSGSRSELTFAPSGSDWTLLKGGRYLSANQEGKLTYGDTASAWRFSGGSFSQKVTMTTSRDNPLYP